MGSASAAAQEEPEDRGAGAVPRGGAGAVARPGKPDPAKKPVVVMPKLVKFVDAPYPTAAEAQGVEGNVVLELTIDATGKVTDAKVAEPAGHGFDEAAQQAALQFEFAPATRDGKPVAARILYRYSFTLKAPPPSKEPPPPPPTTGNLGGALQIAGTTVPLAGAEVVVTGPDGQERRLVTDGQGRWSLEKLPPGVYRVRVAAEGFQSTEAKEEVAVGEATDVTYRLAPKAEEGVLEVTVQGERPPREVTRRTLERREINRIPGTSGDALRSLQSLPGVARPPGLAGLLIVRGSAPEDTETFVDGTGVPLIYHFGGLSSVVPTELLDRIDFYPGNFSARYGRVMGGIVDVGLREPDTSCTGPYGKPSEEKGCYHGMGQVDLIDARVLVQGPIAGSKDWSFAVAGRRSWIDAWITPVLEEAGAGVTSAPVYYDYQVIADNKPTPDSRLSLRAFGSDDRLEILINDPSASDPAFGGNLRFRTASHRAQVVYTGQLNKSVDLTAMASAGRDQIQFSLGNFLFDLDIYPITTRSELGFKVTKGFKLNAGMDFQLAPVKFTVRAPQPPRPGEPDPGPFATRPPLEQSGTITAFRPAWYMEGEVTPTRRLRLVPGVRLDYARDSGHADFSPRFNARYDLVSPTEGQDEASFAGKRKLRTTLKGGVGVFHQPPQFQETDEIFGTPGIESNRAIHYSLGVEQELTRQIEVSVEGFYKDLSNLVARAPSASGGFDYNNQGQGYVVGMETLIKYKPDKRFFGWLAYTLSRSVRQESPDDPEYLFQYDQTHNLIVLGSYRLGRGWEFGARFRIVSGPLTTPLISKPALPALYAADAGAYTPLQGEPFSRRLPLFHQLDVRVDKRWQFKDWRFSAYLDVQNVYNNQAVEALVYNYNFSQESYQTGLPIIPSVGLRGEF
ncbi:MAG: TonB-dependent receptor [Myxococcales bacterium]|nr:TonB-dependent receptor [Myxococcales bacterium]MCB9575875.1 TonB-dependent receptor [Polyangiaceae bacterium]